MPRRQVAGIHELQHEHAQVLVLDRRQASVGQRRDRVSLDLRRAGHLEQRVQISPFGRNPLLVAEQADLRVETLMNDLARDQLRQQRLPLVALSVCADLTRERLIAEQEALRQIEQCLP